MSATGIRYSNVTGMYLSCTTGNKVHRCEQTLHLRAGVSPLYDVLFWLYDNFLVMRLGTRSTISQLFSNSIPHIYFRLLSSDMMYNDEEI